MIHTARRPVYPPLPRRRLLAGVLITACFGTAVHAFGVYTGDTPSATEPSLIELAIGVLPSWLSIGLFLPLVDLATRYSPLSGGRWGRPLLVHVVCANLFAYGQLALVAMYRVLVHSGSFAGLMDTFVSYYYFMNLTLYAAMAAVLHAVHSQRALRRQELAHARQRSALAEARLDTLRHQLNPHFLFNSLNTVAMQARQGLSAEAAETVSRLSDLLRRVLRSEGRNEVPLREELDFVRGYLRVERARFGDRLRARIDCPSELSCALVPFLLLQPIVENAVRHGAANVGGRARVLVRVRRRDDWLRITVRDNGAADARGGMGKGLANTRERLRALYGPRHRFRLQVGPGGATARISLPYRAVERAAGVAAS